MFRKPLRRSLRLTLKLLARAAIRKHNPEVIAVLGDGQTSIAREAIYHILKQEFPTRRNIEPPEKEFIIPLAIVGAREYPANYGGWISLILKTALRIVFLKPHKHFLVLELTTKKEVIFNYWWNLTQPKILVLCGQQNHIKNIPKDSRVYKIANPYVSDPTPYLKTAQRLAKDLNVPGGKIREAKETFELPPSRIRLTAGKGNFTVLDATYSFNPPKKEAIEEIIRSLPGRKIEITKNNLRSQQKIPKNSVVIINGKRSDMWPAIDRFVKSPWELS